MLCICNLITSILIPVSLDSSFQSLINIKVVLGIPVLTKESAKTPFFALRMIKVIKGIDLLYIKKFIEKNTANVSCIADITGKISKPIESFPVLFLQLSKHRLQIGSPIRKRLNHWF